MPNGLLYNKEHPDDEWLLSQMSNDNYAAFSSLYEKYVKGLTGYGFRFTSDLQLVEDSIHDLFVWLWQHRRSLAINTSLKSYILKCMRTSILRKEGHRFLVMGQEESSFGCVESGEEYYIATENENALKEKLSSYLSLLTTKQKEVIYLRFYQGLNFEEIAYNMNLTVKACYKLMGRAMSELRKGVPATNF